VFLDRGELERVMETPRREYDDYGEGALPLTRPSHEEAAARRRRRGLHEDLFDFG